MATILLVEDDDSNRVTLSALLEVDGFAVFTAASCAEARALLASRACPDLILLDHHLGDGVGFDLFPAIRSGAPEARIVVMSGSSEVPLRSVIVDAFFEKGRAFPELVALVRGLLGVAPPADTGRAPR